MNNSDFLSLLPKTYSASSIGNFDIGGGHAISYHMYYSKECIPLETASYIYAIFDSRLSATFNSSSLNLEGLLVFMGYLTELKDNVETINEALNSSKIRKYKPVTLRYELKLKEELIVEGCQTPEQSDSPIIILDIQEMEKDAEGNKVELYKWMELFPSSYTYI